MPKIPKALHDAIKALRDQKKQIAETLDGYEKELHELGLEMPFNVGVELGEFPRKAQPMQRLELVFHENKLMTRYVINQTPNYTPLEQEDHEVRARATAVLDTFSERLTAAIKEHIVKQNKRMGNE